MIQEQHIKGVGISHALCLRERLGGALNITARKIIVTANRITVITSDILERANKGDAQAQACVGNAYLRGNPKDAQLGVTYTRKAADQGHAAAQHDLAQCYQYGYGVEQDDQAAAALYQKAAYQGYADSQHNLATFYHHGRGVKKNDTASFTLYEKAAEQGHALAQLALATCYYKGIVRNCRWL